MDALGYRAGHLSVRGSPVYGHLFADRADRYRRGEVRAYVPGNVARLRLSLCDGGMSFVLFWADLSPTQDLDVSVIELNNIDLGGGSGPGEAADDVLAIIGDIENTASQFDDVMQ